MRKLRVSRSESKQRLWLILTHPVRGLLNNQHSCFRYCSVEEGLRHVRSGQNWLHRDQPSCGHFEHNGSTVRQRRVADHDRTGR